MKVQAAGMDFLIEPDLERWFGRGHAVEVDWNPYWQRFRVQVDGATGC